MSLQALSRAWKSCEWRNGTGFQKVKETALNAYLGGLAESGHEF